MLFWPRMVGMVFIPLIPFMIAMSNLTRVEITDKALSVLKIETALCGMNQKQTLEAIVLRGASPKTLALVDDRAVVLRVDTDPLMEVEAKEMMKTTR